MSDSSFDVDEILKEVRKRREENEERIKAQGTRKSVEINNNTAPAAEKKAEKAGAVDKAQNTVNAVKESVKVQPAQKTEQKPVQQREQKKPVQNTEKTPVKPQAPKTEETVRRAQMPQEDMRRQAAYSQMPQAAVPQRNEQPVVQRQEPAENAGKVHYDTDENGNVNIMNYAEIPQTTAKKGKKGKKKDKKGSKIKKIIISVIAIILVIVIGAGVGTYLYLNKTLDNATDTPEQTQTIDEWTGMDVLEENFTPIYEDETASSYRDMLKKWYYNGTPVSSTHVLNVLLIGEDTRDENITDEDTRADSAIIASVNIDTQQITLTSVLRDSYCYYEVTDGDEESGRYSKINEAMYYGGIDCYIRAIENNFKINIDNYVIVNFDSFKSIIDTLGGITVEMTEAEINEINNHPSRYGNVTIDAQPGLVDLNGEQALAFCRIRYIDSDNARADRQKTVLLKIFEKMSGASTVKSLEVVNKLLPYVKMGFQKSEVIDIGTYALRHGWLGYQINTQTVPENTTDENGVAITTCQGGTFYNMWCWKVDFPLTAQLLQQSIYGKTSITLAEDRPNFNKLPLY